MLRADVERIVRALSEPGPRNVADVEALAAARHLVEHELLARTGGVAAHEYQAEGQTLANVVAEIPGARRREEIVVLGAHYDSAPGSPGANDNATGVAAMLALARRFSGSGAQRTLRFVAFTNEEPPCYRTESMGSLVHARGCAGRGENVVAMLSLETLGCYLDADGSQRYPVPWMGLLYPTRGNFVAFVGDVGSRDLVRKAIAAFRQNASFPSEGAALPDFVPGTGWSDHWAFRQVGIPAAMVTDTAVFRDAAYHTADDVPERVDFDRLARVTLGLVRVVERLSRAAE